MATLASESRTSFILRGKMVREALFCTASLPPPPDAPAEPKLDPGASAKARSEAHRTDPACASCHDLFDPLGFAFEIYDATGRYRTSDAAGPIDARVTLSHTEQLNGKTAANAVELAKLLAGADEVRDCVARQWLRFGLGREDASRGRAVAGRGHRRPSSRAAPSCRRCWWPSPAPTLSATRRWANEAAEVAPDRPQGHLAAGAAEGAGRVGGGGAVRAGAGRLGGARAPRRPQRLVLLFAPHGVNPAKYWPVKGPYAAPRPTSRCPPVTTPS